MNRAVQRRRWRSGRLTCLLTLCGPAAWALEVEELPELPQAVSNNAVAVLERDGRPSLFSFMGLAPGRSQADIHNRAWTLEAGADGWSALPEVPGGNGRLAGVAARAGGVLWLFGGYTVAVDGHEDSTPEVYRWAGQGKWEQAVDMPVPVDDATAHVYQDRYIYLVSGWHDLGNVNLVQVLDTHTLGWRLATPYPGTPVFGHAGGMAGNRMLVCDGVRIDYPADGSARRFLPSAECWLGVVDPADHRRIAWRPVPPHPGPPLYRMAAGADDRGRVVFAGGSDNPYNYDGIGYDGVPSRPSGGVFSFDVDSLAWIIHGALPVPSMDHRGLPYSGGWFYLLGGMRAGQQVTAAALRFRLSPGDGQNNGAGDSPGPSGRR